MKPILSRQIVAALSFSRRERNEIMYHLAQVNIARMLAPLADALMAEFVAQLDAINALAESSPGFVWRLQTPEGNATALRPYEDDLILINISLWASLAYLSAFVYQSRHRSVMQRRRQVWSGSDPGLGASSGAHAPWGITAWLRRRERAGDPRRSPSAGDGHPLGASL
jgi:hypothetical protein